MALTSSISNGALCGRPRTDEGAQSVVRLRGLKASCKNLIIHINFCNNSAPYQQGYQHIADAGGALPGKTAPGACPALAGRCNRSAVVVLHWPFTEPGRHAPQVSNCSNVDA